MNPNDPATTPVAATPSTSGDIPGIARVETLPPPRGGSGTSLPANTIMGDFVAGLLGLVTRALSPSLVERSLSFARMVGHYAVLAGGALTVVYAIYGAIKFNSFAVFAVGLGFVAALAVAQFAAIRFLAASDTLIASTPSRVSSSAFLECVGLLALLAAVGMLLSGIAGAITAQSVLPLVPALIFAVTLTCFGALALHPRLVNVDTGAGSAGEEAIGLLSFFFKAGLKLVSLYFGLFAIGGSLTILTSFFGSGSGPGRMMQDLINTVPMPMQVPYGLSGSAFVVFACLVPIASYFFFLLEYLVVDVLRAVLCVPGKLDNLKR